MAATYVVDASIVIQRFLQENYTPQAQVLLDGMYQGDQLYIPEFCLLECANVLRTNVQSQKLPQTEAEQFIRQLLALPFQIVQVNPLLFQALQIGLIHQLAIYDSLYIALALNLNCPLITVDARQLNAAIASGVVIKPITDFLPSDNKA